VAKTKSLLKSKKKGLKVDKTKEKC